MLEYLGGGGWPDGRHPFDTEQRLAFPWRGLAPAKRHIV